MSAPHQRRGLGRGLGALIPTAPRTPEVAATPPAPATEASTSTSADWIGTPLPADESVTVPDSPASLVDPAVEEAPGASEAAEDRDPTTDEQAAAPPDPESDAADTASGAVPGTPQRGASAGSALAAGGAWFAELPLGEIRPNPRQPREVFDEEAMAELVHSITEVGLLQPVVVRPVEDGYELVMGERRWRATREAGLTTIPAIVRETGDDDLLRDALLENLHRAQLNALEEAAAYQQLLDDFGCTHDELASRIGRSRPQISNTLRLLKLPPAVQRRVAAGVLSAGHARALLAVPDPEQQDRLAGRVVAEGISVRSLEELVAVGDASRPPSARRARPTAPGVDHLATRLSERLDTRVRVELGRRKGRITVEFASLPDLERIVRLIEGDESVKGFMD